MKKAVAVITTIVVGFLGSTFLGALLNWPDAGASLCNRSDGVFCPSCDRRRKEIEKMLAAAERLKWFFYILRMVCYSSAISTGRGCSVCGKNNRYARNNEEQEDTRPGDPPQKQEERYEQHPFGKNRRKQFLQAFGLKLGEGQDKFVSHPIRSLAQALRVPRPVYAVWHFLRRDNGRLCDGHLRL